MSEKGKEETPLDPLALPLVYEDVFPSNLPPGLPLIRGIEYQINLFPGASLPNKSAYRSNPTETKELQCQLQVLIDRGYIRETTSPCSFPTSLVPENDETMRIGVDSHAITNITIKYRYPIPRLNDMLHELYVAKAFSRIELRSGYHEIRMRDADEWKTTFKTKQGLYEWLVMPFGLSNASRTFI